MSEGSAKKNFFATHLLQLQNFIKRDATSYKDEFLQTYHNYESTLQVFLTSPSKPSKQLADLALFLAHVSHCFADELKSYPQELIDILKKYATVLDPDMRQTFCRCLMLMRSKNLIEPLPIFEVFFSLIKCPDKALRKFLYTYMLSETRRIKTKLKNYKLCSQLQQYVFTLTRDPHPLIAKHATTLLIDLYKKQVWNDAKTVNIVAAACLTNVPKVVAAALKFFSGDDKEDEKPGSDSDNEKKTEAEVLLSLRVGKKTSKRQKRTSRALKAIKREKKTKNRGKNVLPSFSALNLIYDPQDFAEKLFKQVEATNEGFNFKLAILDLVARLIGVHALYLHNFHTYLMRFLNPHQREVPKMLWFVSVSCHDLTPPDTVEPILMAIANNFISERNSSEVIAVGLNAVREISARCPLAMTDELLGDLVEYRTYKDKGVSFAAKSIIQLFREKNPQMLHKRMRGKPTEASIEAARVAKQYGEIDARAYVPGAEVVESDADTDEEENENTNSNRESGSEDDEWEECSDEEQEKSGDEDAKKKKSVVTNKKRKHSEDEDDDDDSEEGWVDVSSDEEGDLPQVEDKLTLAEKEERASKKSTDKIFTQEDFKRIRVAQMKKAIDDKNFMKTSKKKSKNVDIDSGDSDDGNKRDGLIPYTAITRVNKKAKHDKESRMATVLEGREGREKFGHRFKDSKLGKSNKEKLKNKAFPMLRHKIQRKAKRSFKEKQMALQASLLKQKKMK